MADIEAARQSRLPGNEDSIGQEPPLHFAFYINSSNIYYRIWKLITTLLLVYISWISPYTIGFIHEITRGLKIADYIISAIFLVDASMSMITPYVDKKSNVVITDKGQMARNFLLGWGTVDSVLAIIPTSVMFQIFPRQPFFAKVWSFLRLVLVRKVFKTISDMKTDKHRSINSFLKWMKPLFVALFCVHCSACIFHLIATMKPDYENTWLILAEEEINKETNRGLFLYIMSIYWSTTVFSTVGYGDLHPVNGLEMAFNIASMLFNMGLATYVLNNVSELLTGNDQVKRFRENSQVLRDFGRTYDLPGDLQQEMYTFMSLESPDDSDSSLFNILNIFPKEIQMKVRHRIFSQVIQNVYLFHGVSQSLIFEMLAEMDIEILEPNAFVVMANEFPKKLHILVQGKIVREMANDAVLQQICGEYGVVSFLPQPFSVRTTESSTLLTLDRTKFVKLLQVNTDDGDVIVTNLMKVLDEQKNGDPVLGSLYHRFNKRIDRGELDIALSVRLACKRSNSRLLLHLIKGGEDLEDLYENEQTILHVAVNEGCDSCIISVLLEYSANIDKRDSSHRPPLCCAILKRGEPSGKSILDLFRTKGATLPSDEAIQYLFEAVKDGDLDMLQIISDFGGDINIINDDKGTPLHFAVYLDKIEVVKYLLKLKAKVHLKDKRGFTPVYLATYVNEDILELLRNHEGLN